MTQEDLNAIRQLMKEELEPINQRLNTVDQKLESIDQRLNKLEESQEELRTGVNTLLEWADRVSDTYQFPLPAVGE